MQSVIDETIVSESGFSRKCKLNLTMLMKAGIVSKMKSPSKQRNHTVLLARGKIVVEPSLVVMHQPIPAVPIPPPPANAGHLLTLSVPGVGHSQFYRNQSIFIYTRNCIIYMVLLGIMFKTRLKYSKRLLTKM